MASKPLILVTGATGYVGAHIVEQALDVGYPVRVTSFPGKINSSKGQFGEGVEVVEMIDIATGDLTNALRGVEIVIHAAAPHVGETDLERVISGTVDGTLNIARQAAKANVKRIVFTSSWSACVDMGDPAACFSNYVFTEKDWNSATTEQVLSGKHNKNPVWLHGAAKSLAEQEIWKFADDHPEVDVTTINPPFIYGPLAKGTKINKEVLRTHPSLGRFYSLLLAGSSLLELPPSLAIPIAVDVRDVARAHILALTAPPTTEIGRKRILIGGRNFRMCDVSEHRVTPIATIDTSRAKEILGYNEPLPWKKTVNDMINKKHCAALGLYVRKV
ncbi:NAD dependent epimerase/dehydratase family domain-containing protein [Trichoderma breve]|uniref:NAD dependent epimerase/dehydratase family domain-containing protein n=1 Tax=Trichoderma breve TaxID=2034170 RepID=A0A9W9B7I4_9HYPO|nr:NAD dependent epimerase/dehydratase family domain-containing protein [Trichoderma breve]KAJ4858042.1 NAD dependent epimerase/dehydratase family domain-containing protein [Trichoderma breve]